MESIQTLCYGHEVQFIIDHKIEGKSKNVVYIFYVVKQKGLSAANNS